MVIKWVTGRSYNKLIDSIECERETEKSVFLKVVYCGKEQINQERKRSNYSNYFDTWEEARDFLLKRSERNLKCIRGNLERARGKHGNIRGLKKPNLTA